MKTEYHTKIAAMTEGGALLGQVKKQLRAFTHVGTRFEDIEAEAQRLIKAVGAKPSFSTVPGYSWATCLMKNDETCHGIPRHKVVEDGDVMKIDVGLIWQGYHLDTTDTFVVGKSTKEIDTFLAVGRKSLQKAIERARVGNSVYDVSAAMEKVVTRGGYNLVYQLCGHGISKELHEKPDIPCLAQRADKRVIFYEGQTVAIEVMYTMGNAHLIIDKDGWTYRTADRSLSGMYEETVLITAAGPKVLTSSP
jgi:methionyl aminopeptidase